MIIKIETLQGLMWLSLAICAVSVAAPAIALWGINSLAEAGGAEFYIEHTVWNYWVTLVMLLPVLVRF